MLRQLLTLAAIALAGTAVAQTPGPVIYYQSAPLFGRSVIVSRPQQPQPAVGLAASSSPLYFAPDFSIGGPGYMYRGYPPHNGWSSGYRGAYYGEPVPGSAARRGPWSR